MFYPLDYVIEKIIENQLSKEQFLLKQFSGKRFGKREAAVIWDRVIDHKWHVSERLGRDVGTRVAVIDFIENIYEPPKPKRASRTFSRIPFGRPEGVSVI